MNLKLNILICGPNQFSNNDLLIAAVPADILPQNLDEDIGISDEADALNDASRTEAAEKQMCLIRRIIETPVANFIEANELTELGEEGEFPDNLSMADYVKKVEAELHARDILSENNAKIDVIWFSMGVEASFADESEKDFIRSAAGVPNALIVAEPAIISTRSGFRKEIDTLTGLSGSKRVVLAPTASSGTLSISSGMCYLLKRTKQIYLNSVNASEEEEKAFEAAWEKFYEEKFNEWQEDLNNTLPECIELAARRANFILNKTDNVSLTDLVEEGIDLLSELIEIVKGNTDVEEKPGKTALAHTAELKENIEFMIYEIAACYGRVATAHDIEIVFRHSKASMLPKNAAAITYAVGQVAKAVFEPGIEYNSRDLLAIYREAKEEAMEMTFKPFDDNDSCTWHDDDKELNEEDIDDSDMDNADESDIDIHEPEDELPDDCIVDGESANGTDKQKKEGD